MNNVLYIHRNDIAFAALNKNQILDKSIDFLIIF